MKTISKICLNLFLITEKIVLIIFLTQNDDDLLKECAFLKSDVNCLNKDFETVLIEQNEAYLDYIKKKKNQ